MSATNGFTESTNSTACSTSQGATDCGRVVSVDTEIADRFLLCYFSQVNCSGEWSAWNSCNASSCGEGVELRYFQPSQLAVYGGEACPASPESRPCTDTIECPVSPVCLVCLKANVILLFFSQVSCSGDWSAWTACNASSCGEGVELRYFQPSQLAAFGGEACPVSPESRPCTDSTECPVSPVCLACILHSSLVLSAQLQRRFERMEL